MVAVSAVAVEMMDDVDESGEAHLELLDEIRTWKTRLENDGLMYVGLSELMNLIDAFEASLSGVSNRAVLAKLLDYRDMSDVDKHLRSKYGDKAPLAGCRGDWGGFED